MSEDGNSVPETEQHPAEQGNCGPCLRKVWRVFRWFLPVIALICGVVLIGWAEYNRVRFSKADRRKRRVKTNEEQVRISLGASPALAAKLRDGRIVRLALDDDARPVAATSGS